MKLKKSLLDKSMKTVAVVMSIFFSLNLFASASPSVEKLKIAKYSTFKCSLSADFGEMDASLKKEFTPLSPSENYLQLAEHFDLKVSALFNEDGRSYTVEAMGAKGFHVKTTVPYYPDAELRFAYEFNDSDGSPVANAEFVVQCKR